MSIGDRRVEYGTAGLSRADLDSDPVDQLLRWYAQADGAGCTEPNAMVLATLGGDGAPDARIVLARGIDADGITFHTNRTSAKGVDLERLPRAAAVFGWLEIHRQVRVRGPVRVAPDAASDAYFAGRPRESQIGAWASPQSRPVRGRAELDGLLAAATERFAGAQVPRPPFWGGYVLGIDEIEFWQGRPNRLHDRFRYRRDAWGGWLIERLAP